MLVRMEIGRDKGELKDMPPDVAQTLLNNGGASLPTYRTEAAAEVVVGVDLSSTTDEVTTKAVKKSKR